MHKSKKRIRPLIDFCEDMESLYRQIQRRCRRSGKTIRKLCLETKVSQSTMWRWRKGDSVPSIDVLLRLETRLRVWEREDERIKAKQERAQKVRLDNALVIKQIERSNVDISQMLSLL